MALPHGDYPSRAAHESAVRAALAAAGVEWVCLAGYMRLLSAEFVAAFPERILNIHPSLLPAFPGLHPQRQALAAGVKISGCTVHFVDSGLDSGPIVLQRAVAVEENDDEASLAGRILVEEHLAYPEALRRLLTKRWYIEGRRLRLLAEPRIVEKKVREGVDRIRTVSYDSSPAALQNKRPSQEGERGSKTGRSAAVSESLELPRNSSSSRQRRGSEIRSGVDKSSSLL